MQKLKYLLLPALFLFSQSVYCQFTIQGRIVDSASGEPLSGASVYCQNTTLGTVTNKEGHFSLSLKSGGYDLVISFTGYQTQQVRISQSQPVIPDILLIKEDKSLGEVVIRSSNEVKDGWEKYGSFFIDHFIGTTPFSRQTQLENPEVLKFFLLKKAISCVYWLPSHFVSATKPSVISLSISSTRLYTPTITTSVHTADSACLVNWKVPTVCVPSGPPTAKKTIWVQSCILCEAIMIVLCPKMDL